MVNINQKMVNIISAIGPFTDCSIHSISKSVKEPYTSVHRIIKKLASLGVVSLQEKGKSILVCLNIGNELARYIASIAGYTGSLHLCSKHPLLKILKDGFEYNAALILFGSYAKSKETASSDIDICAIGLNKIDEQSFKRSIRQIEMIHKKQINCLFFRKNEFTDMLKAKSMNVGKQILINHIVLKNADLWYNYLSEVKDEIRL